MGADTGTDDCRARADRPARLQRDLDAAEVEAALALIRLRVATRVRLSNLRHPRRVAARFAGDGTLVDVSVSICQGRRPSLLLESVGL